MKRKIASILAAAIIVFTLAGYGVGSILAIDENTAEIAATAGQTVTPYYYAPGQTLNFQVKDADIDTEGSGTATLTVAGKIQTKTTFNIVDAATAPNTLVTVKSASGIDYDKVTPANTPLKSGAVVVSVTSPAGTYTAGVVSTGPGDLVTIAAATPGNTTAVVITFGFEVTDVYDPYGAPVRKIAHVASSSDSVGEWVTLKETTATSGLFDAYTVNAKGLVLSGAIAKIGAETGATGEQYVVDGDTITVSYYAVSTTATSGTGALIDTDTARVDAGKPSIANVSPALGTSTAPTRVNTLKPLIQFDVTDAGIGINTSGITLDFDINDNGTYDGGAESLTGALAFQPMAGGYRVSYFSNVNWLIDGTDSTWRIVAKDKLEEADASATSNDRTSTGYYIADVTKPTVVGAWTGKALDITTSPHTEKSNVTTAVRVEFTEVLDATTVQNTDFTVDGVVPASAVTTTASTPTDLTKYAYLTMASAMATDAKPVVIAVGELKDRAGNAMKLLEADGTVAATAKATAADKIAPTVTVTVSPALVGLKSAATAMTITVATSERLAAAPTVSLNRGDAVGTTITFAAATTGAARYVQNTVTSWTYTYDLGTPTAALATTFTGQGAVTVGATDLAGNTGYSALTTVTTEDVSASRTPTGVLALNATVVKVKVANYSIADYRTGGTANTLPDADLKGDITIEYGAAGTENEATVTDVNVDTGEITFDLDGVTGMAATDKVTATYKYSSLRTQFDKDAPTVAFSPAEGETIAVTSPWITLTFDEDEYQGDTSKTVTVTEFTFDGVNKLSELTTIDNIKFVYVATGLTTGKSYKVTARAKDATANEMAAATSATFKVVAPAAVTIDLQPGWNLISSPVTPADASVSAVFAATPSVTKVYTLDAGKWVTAIKDATTGTWLGDLKTLARAKGYYAYSSGMATLSVTPSAAVDPSALPEPPQLALSKGWNLIGFASLTPGVTQQKVEDYLFSVMTNWTFLYSYNPNPGVGLQSVRNDAMLTDSALFDEDGAGAPVVKQGKGYWLYMTAADTLLIP